MHWRESIGKDYIDIILRLVDVGQSELLGLLEVESADFVGWLEAGFEEDGCRSCVRIALPNNATNKVRPLFTFLARSSLNS